MKKLIGYGSLSLFVASFLLSPVAFIFWGSQGIWLCVITANTFGRIVLKDTLNTLQVVGPVYWITRDYVPKGTRFASIGFMKQIDEPWRVGTGLHLNLWKRTFQIGICHKQHYTNSMDGELSVVGGRLMDTAPTEIGAW
jgi:hypothetical protein